jgi:hypothetical protein
MPQPGLARPADGPAGSAPNLKEDRKMNHSNPLALALVPILAAAVCLGGCKKQEEAPAPTTATESAASAASSADMASSVSGVGAAGAMASASASADSASGAMASDSAASR